MLRRNAIKAMIASASALVLAGCNKQAGKVVYADLVPLLGDNTSDPSVKLRAARPVTTRVSAFGGDLVAAIASLPQDGGVVDIDQTIYLTGTVNVRFGVELVSSVALPGNNGTNNSNTDHTQQRHILVARGVSPALILHSSSGLNGLFLHKEGVTFGDSSSYAFTDTAVSIAGEDAYVNGCFITGFDQAVDGHFVQRSTITGNRIDCLNGVALFGVWDVARVVDNHCWPFVTVPNATPDNWRQGTAFRFSDVGDWNQLRGNFCFGYATGYLLHNVQHVTAVQCGADYAMGLKRGVGFHVTGDSKDTSLVACKAAGQDIGFLNETSGKDLPDQMIGCSHWANNQDIVGWD